MKNIKNVLNEAGVSLVTAILVLTSIVIFPTMMAQAPLPEHDIGVSNIISPFSGCLRNYPVNITVKNSGNNSETSDVQVNIFKWDAGPQLLYENFSDGIIPAGWVTDYWFASVDTNEAGGVSPEARMYYYDQYYPHYDFYDNYILSKTVDTGNYDIIKVEFNFTADIYDPYYQCYFHVYWTNDSGNNWNEITPWVNPITIDIGPERYSIVINCNPGDYGDAFQVKWEYTGYYYYYKNFYLDDVEIVGGTLEYEYPEFVEDVTIPKDEDVVANASYWMPSGCGEYCVTAFTLLEDDENLSNDCLTKNLNIISLESAVEKINYYIQNLPDIVFKPPATNRKNVFSIKLNVVVIDMITSVPPNYGGAISKLQNDIRPKVDGGWITDPTAQQELCEMIDNLIACLGTMI